MIRSALLFACLPASVARPAACAWTASEGGASFQGELHDWIFAPRQPSAD